MFERKSKKAEREYWEWVDQPNIPDHPKAFNGNWIAVWVAIAFVASFCVGVIA